MSAGGSCSSLRQSSPCATTRARERSFQLLELAAAVELVRASPPDQHTRRRAEPSSCLVRLRLLGAVVVPRVPLVRRIGDLGGRFVEMK